MKDAPVFAAYTFIVLVSGWFLRDVIMWIKIAFRGQYHCDKCGHRQPLKWDDDE